MKPTGKGEDIINMNLRAIDKGVEMINKVEIPAGWADAVDSPGKAETCRNSLRR